MAERPPFLPGQYNTQLSPMEEFMFRGWVQQNSVPFNANADVTDYDMRGFWQGLQQQNPMAQSAVNPIDNRIHYPDYWKTPLHQTFSNESQWGGIGAPQWINGSRLASPSGRIVFDEAPPFGGILGNLGRK